MGSGSSFGGKARKFEGAGGTPGGLGQFFLGVVLAGLGTYLILNQVDVHTSMWRLWGNANMMGLTLLPLVLGVGILFFNGKSIVGWLLSITGFGIVIVGVFTTMDFTFRRTSLFNVLLMLGMMASGLGLVAKSLRPQPGPADAGGGGSADA